MPAPRAEVDVNPGLVGVLLREQHPDLADLPITFLAQGWDNAIFRLGDDLVVRMPRRLASAALVLHEQRWLPELAKGLPLPVPVPVRIGLPGADYPWAWSVCPWLPGVEIERSAPDDWVDTAVRLGLFLAAVHRPAPPGAPHNPFRGVPLVERSALLAEGLGQMPELDTERIAEAWESAVSVEGWAEPPVWLHGDVHPLNLLVDGGRLSAVIDFGDLTAGDPASDLAVGWMLFDGEARSAFRDACGDRRPVDDALWERAKGWAIALGVALANGDDRVSAIGHRTLAEVLAEP